MEPRTLLPYRMTLPETAGPWPALIMVHGWLGNENVMRFFAATVPEGTALFSPRGVYPAGPGGFGWFSEQPTEEEVLAGVRALEDFILALPRQHPIDRKRVTLMGFSQGAAICAALWLHNPGIAERVALLAGFLPRPARAWATRGRLNGRSAFIAHGLNDTTVPVDHAQVMRDSLERAGAEVAYGEYLIGHKMNSQALRDLKDWLADRPG